MVRNVDENTGVLSEPYRDRSAGIISNGICPWNQTRMNETRLGSQRSRRRTERAIASSNVRAWDGGRMANASSDDSTKRPAMVQE